MSGIRAQRAQGDIVDAAGHPLGKRKTEARLEDKFLAKKVAWSRKPDILQTRHRVFLGDSREMRGLDRETPVHLVVTSPPYWNLKEYAEDHDGAQLGHLDDLDEYLREVGRVWENCFSLLVPGGRLCIVVGDVCRSRRAHGRHRVEPLHSFLSVQCRDIGFDPLAPIIWNKIANMATEVNGNGAGFLGKPYEPNAIIKNDIEYILMFRKPGGYRHPTQEQRDLSLIDKEDHKRWFLQLWNDVRGDSQARHPAPFPVEIPRRLIGMFSFVGDTVLDPFWGLGNTTRAAMQMHRSSIGFELEPAYFNLAQRDTLELLGNHQIEFVAPE